MHRLSSLCAWGCALLLYCAFEAAAQTSPATQALERGLEAAKRQDWNEAIRQFSLAQERAHLSPKVMYNLGLAYARSGNDVLANAWLRAYLSAVPDTSNAPQVRAEIERLDGRGRQRVRILLKEALKAADQISSKPRNILSPDIPSWSARSQAYDEIAEAYGGIGELEIAKRIEATSRDLDRSVGVYRSATRGPNRWLELRTVQLIGADDVPGTERALTGFDDKSEKIWSAEAWRAAVGQALLRMGDYTAAEKIWLELQPPYKGIAHSHDNLGTLLVEAAIRRGDLERAIKVTEGGPGTDDRAFAIIAELQSKRGNFAAAEQTVNSFKEPQHRRQGALNQINLEKAARGNEVARTAFRQDADDRLRRYASEPLVTFYPGAYEEYAADIVYDALRVGLRDLAERAAQVSRNRIPQNYPGHNAARARAYLLAIEGKIDEALSTLRQAQDRIRVSPALASTARSYATKFLRSQQVKLIDLLVDLGRLEDAERATERLNEGAARLLALNRIADAAAKSANVENSQRLRVKAATLRTEAMLGEPIPAERAAIIERWLAVIDRVEALAVAGDATELMRIVNVELGREAGAEQPDFMMQFVRERQPEAAVEVVRNAAVSLDQALHLLRVYAMPQKSK